MALFSRQPASCRCYISLSLQRGEVSRQRRVSKVAPTTQPCGSGQPHTWQEHRVDVCCGVGFMLQRQHAVHARLEVVY